MIDINTTLIIAMSAIIVVVLGIAIIQGFQIAEMNNKISALATAKASGSSGSLDMSGWTEQEKMMYEHHGTLPERLQSSSPSSSGMVGGC